MRSRAGACAVRHTHQYQDGAGLPALRRARSQRSCAAENGIDVARGSRVMVTAGANMAFMHAVLAITEPGRRDHPAGAVLLQPRDGDRDGRLPRRARRRPTSAISSTRRDRARDHRRARARSSRSRRTTRAARCYREAGAARASTRSAGSAGCTTSPTRPTSTSPTATRATSSPGSFAGRRRAHHLAVLAVEGLRLRRLAHRLHGVSRAAGVGDDEESGHDPDLPDRSSSQVAAVAALDVGRAYCEPHVRALAAIREIVVVAAVGARAAGARCRRPTARSTACIARATPTSTR